MPPCGGGGDKHHTFCPKSLCFLHSWCLYVDIHSLVGMAAKKKNPQAELVLALGRMFLLFVWPPLVKKFSFFSLTTFLLCHPFLSFSYFLMLLNGNLKKVLLHCNQKKHPNMTSPEEKSVKKCFTRVTQRLNLI